MMRWKIAVVGVLVAVAGVAGAGPSAAADGPQNAEQAAVCSKMLGSLLPGLVPTSMVCKINSAG